MAGVDDLKGPVLNRIAKAISPQNMRAIGAIYFGFQKHEIVTLERNVDFLNKWKAMSYHNNRQLLADILYHAVTYRLIDIRKIKEHLGEKTEESGKPVLSQDPPDVNSRLTESELGRLALKVSPKNMRELAQSHLEYDPQELEAIEDTQGNDQWMKNFQVLVDWKNLSYHNERKKLAEILYEAAEVDKLLDIRFIWDVLGVSKDMLAEEEGTSGDASSKPIDETKDANQQTTVEYERERDHADGSSKPEASGASSGPTGNQMQPLNFIRDLKRKLTGTKFPEGQPIAKLPLKDPEYKDFDWMNMDLMKDVTLPMTGKVKPVVVAVLDTGICEGHPRLKKHIVTSRSKCFGTGKAGDLVVDELNHGTMVTGIIVLKGPDNVRIINLKVMPGTTADMVAALKHIQTLDGTSDEVDIINISAGQFKLEEGLDEVINELASNKIIIAAAGNYSAHSSNTVTYPGKHPNVICVGACDSDGKPAGHSSVGKEVAFLCPGERVLSTNNMINAGGAEYFAANGTSFSAPHAIAVAAHVLVAMETKGAADTKEGKEAVPDYRKKLRKNLVMKNVFLRMRDSAPPGEAGVLQPFNNCFRNLELLYDHCNLALEGRETYVTK